jgi:hypothetical protein
VTIQLRDRTLTICPCSGRVPAPSIIPYPLVGELVDRLELLLRRLQAILRREIRVATASGDFDLDPNMDQSQHLPCQTFCKQFLNRRPFRRFRACSHSIEHQSRCLRKSTAAWTRPTRGSVLDVSFVCIHRYQLRR